MSKSGLERAQKKMRDGGQSEEAIRVFTRYYTMVEEGASGQVPETDIVPFTDPESSADLQFSEQEKAEALRRTAVIKLNGGLGTSMGLSAAKTLLPVKDDYNFLDVIVRQVLSLREQTEASLPLIFMNSFRTDADTREYLANYPDLAIPGIPLAFLQSQEPRLYADTLEPISSPADPESEWCPPGHGDVYPSLASSGVLAALLDRGYLYAQISNGDNLGATPDPALAAWFAASGADFAMEVCRRTPNDRKGGHLARNKHSGRLLLREVAQTPQNDLPAFQNIDLHPFFNTNTLWVHLPSLAEALEESGSVLDLPLIRNLKPEDPEDPSSRRIIQIESAMGAAIQVFQQATAVEVPRTRFLPVKTTNELLLLRSNLYELQGDGKLSPQTEVLPRIDLAPPYYGSIGAFEQRIPEPPSLRDATSLTVEGDWAFLPGASVHGDLRLGPEGGQFG